MALGVLLDQALDCKVLLLGALACIVLAAHKSGHLASMTVSYNLWVVAIALTTADRLHILIEMHRLLTQSMLLEGVMIHFRPLGSHIVVLSRDLLLRVLISSPTLCTVVLLRRVRLLRMLATTS